MTHRSLEDLLQAAPTRIHLLRNSQTGPYAFPVVRPEFSNWRDEQRAWRQTCALMDQSHHMTDLYVSGPDAFELLESDHNQVNIFTRAGWDPTRFACCRISASTAFARSR